MFEPRDRDFQLIGIERERNELVVTPAVCCGCALPRGLEARESDRRATNGSSRAIHHMP